VSLVVGAPTREDAQRLDAEDQLASLRDRFVITDPERIYLDGNSLGMQPKATVAALQQAIEEWGRDLVIGWRSWIHLPREIGDLLAANVVEAQPGEVMVSDSTTVNLYKLTLAALHERPGRKVIVTDDENFPTDRYVFEGLATERGLEIRVVHADPVDGVDPGAVAAAVDADTALVSFSHVSYRSAAIHDMPGITEIAHSAGALMLWDLSHSSGSVRVPLESSGADLATGCTYKYLNAGPGAPAYLYVRRTLGDLRSPIWGWFGHRHQFAMPPSFEPAEGIERFLAGAPTVLSMTRHSGRREADRRGRDRPPPAEGLGAHRARHPPRGRMARTSRLRGGIAARRVPARLARQPHASEREGDGARAHPRGERRDGLPPAEHRARRDRPAHDAIRRRMGRRRSSPCARGARRRAVARGRTS